MSQNVETTKIKSCLFKFGNYENSRDQDKTTVCLKRRGEAGLSEGAGLFSLLQLLLLLTPVNQIHTSDSGTDSGLDMQKQVTDT